MKTPWKDGDALIRTVLWEHWHLEATGIHCLGRLESVERTITELMARSINGRI